MNTNERKLTAKDVIYIRESKRKVAVSKLARRFGIDSSTIYSVQSGRRYQWVIDENSKPPVPKSVGQEEFLRMVEEGIEWVQWPPEEVTRVARQMRADGYNVIRKVRYEIID